MQLRGLRSADCQEQLIAGLKKKHDVTWCHMANVAVTDPDQDLKFELLWLKAQQQSWDDFPKMAQNDDFVHSCTVGEPVSTNHQFVAPVSQSFSRHLEIQHHAWLTDCNWQLFSTDKELAWHCLASTSSTPNLLSKGHNLVLPVEQLNDTISFQSVWLQEHVFHIFPQHSQQCASQRQESIGPMGENQILQQQGLPTDYWMRDKEPGILA